MDNDIEKKKNAIFYKYSESGIKMRNYELWEKIISIPIQDISFKEKFYLYENRMISKPFCYCGKDLKFLDMVNGYRRFCSRKCMLESDEIKNKRKKTCIEKYGVDNPSKSKKVKNIVKETNKRKYGVDYPLQSNLMIEKNKEYFLQKYGVNNPSKLPEVREKAKNTTKLIYGVDHIMKLEEVKNNNRNYFLQKYGVDNPSKLPEVREKAKNTTKLIYGSEYALQNIEIFEKMKSTNLLKYGVDFYTKSNDYKEKINSFTFNKNSSIVNDNIYTLINTKNDEYEINCKVCNKNFIIQRQLYRNRIKYKINICLMCNPISNGISIDEKNVLSFIKENYSGRIVENFKLDKKEIDIFLPDLNLGFEFNGLYWHSELNKPKNYHRDKLSFFREKNINIITIWEDEWTYKQDIVKSMILNRIGKTYNKIFARKCKIKLINDNKLVKKFLEENHIQGFIGSKIKVGLFYNDEMVSLMTFGSLRRSLGQRSKINSYELLRFCNRLNTNVIGGASKLLNYFLKNYNPKDIITYSLNSYSNGSLYEKIGFTLLHDTKYNYFWSKNSIRYHRFNFRKDKIIISEKDKNKTESEIMYERGYFRVFDSGSKKWRLEQGGGI